MRLRVVAAAVLQLLAVTHSARIDSGDFGKVLGQITKGNKMEQCPCVRPPEGGACISYDSRYQASHVEEAMISFVDLTLPDRERPTDADSLACVSAECRACFSLLFYRIIEIGLLPRTYRPAIPILPQASLSPSMCPRLRFPSPDDFSAAATAAAAAVPPSAALAGLIERGHRFERSAQAAAAASAALSHLKDLESKHNNHHHGHKGNRDKNNDQHNHNNSNNNNNNPRQTQVTPAQQQGQQQLRVQQPSWQQQQQAAQQAQQARFQAQQQQAAQQAQQARFQAQQQQLAQQQQIAQQQQFQQQQSQFNAQQQFQNQQFQNQQFQNQQFPQQQFPNQQFPNQFNPQDQLSNAARFLQTARQINSIADSISMATHGGTRLLNRWREGYEHGGGPRPRPDQPGPQPQEPGYPPDGSSESGEHGGYPDHPGHGHHHHHHLQRIVPDGVGPRGAGPPQLPPFVNNAGAQISAGTQAGFPGAFPGIGGGTGGGFGGGGGGGGHWPWRRSRSSPLERRRRAILASQTGANQKVEMEVVSPLVSPLIPKELRPMPVEITYNHDAEHIFSEERSAFAELVRDKRQMSQRGGDDDGILGSRFTIACFNRGESENGGDDKMLSLCGGCWVWRRLPEGFFPPIVNELVCKKEDKCLSGWGRCVDKTRSVNVLRKVRGQWTAATLSTGTCCDCKVVAGSEIHALIVG